MMLSRLQQYIVRCALAGPQRRTILHKGRIVEILKVQPTLRLVLPLIEPDAAVSDRPAFWVPRRQSDRKRFNVDRRNKSRRHIVIGAPCWTGEPRPFMARGVKPRSHFPDYILLRRLAGLGYDRAALKAALAKPMRMLTRPDKKKAVVSNSDVPATQEFQPLDYGDNTYIAAPSRRTTRGGGFTEAQVLMALKKMHTVRTNPQMSKALVDVVYRRLSPLRISEDTGIPVEKLSVYASRLRSHIRLAQAQKGGQMKEKELSITKIPNAIAITDGESLAVVPQVDARKFAHALGITDEELNSPAPQNGAEPFTESL